MVEQNRREIESEASKSEKEKERQLKPNIAFNGNAREHHTES